MQSALQSFVRDWQTTVNPSHVAPLSAFLDMIAYAEGTLKFGDENGYNVIVGGATFNDYSDHPRVLVNLPNLGIKSTAAGRYQILSRFWDAYKKQMNLPDFGSDSQDRYAIQQIHEQGAYYDVIKGDFGTAIRKCSNIWASLPGAGYGQREVDRDQLIVYAKARLLTYQADELA
ncbi:MAG: glycoside hydrolase family 104 protein [Methylomicrobium sp.]|nr:glycoside hydrolase family 104 protein [Methylomicrobium sp.]